ncbi:MAG: AI-2E family transporter [Acidobacteria bacterium]|nr:AI-2E family transporter [Acidobacteriota bacterium]
MDDSSKTLKAWATFAGCVLVVVVLYWAQAVLVPFALAVLLTFVLTPPVTWLERWIGRVPAVLLVVTLVFTGLGLAGWGLTRQLDRLASDLPGYRANIRHKIADVRGAGRGGTVEKLQTTLDEIKTELGETPPPTGTMSRPVVIAAEEPSGLAGFAWLGPVLGPLSTAALVLAMVIFMLLERRDLRDRLISLFGQGRLAITTKAFDEAGTRVSRQLLMQSLVNLIYGIAVAAGLYFLTCRIRSCGGCSARRFDSFRMWVRFSLPGPHSHQPCGARRLERSAARRRIPACSRSVHQPGSRDSAVCGSRRHIAGRAARLRCVLDVALGAARPAPRDAADRLPGGARQARARARIRGHAHG